MGPFYLKTPKGCSQSLWGGCRAAGRHPNADSPRTPSQQLDANLLIDCPLLFVPHCCGGWKTYFDSSESKTYGKIGTYYYSDLHDVELGKDTMTLAGYEYEETPIGSGSRKDFDNKRLTLVPQSSAVEDP